MVEMPSSHRLLDRLRAALRTHHYSRRTEQAYSGWVRRYILFHGKRHPEDMGATEVAAFLTDLAVRKKVSASTQNQALCAVLFLYRHVVGREMGEMNNLVRAQRPQRLPLVLTRTEVSRILAEMEGPTLLMASLLYGAGLRLLECCRLRTKDLDFERREILLRNGKGRKDRVTMLPESLASDLTTHLEGVQELHRKDLADGMGSVELPAALERKYPRAPWEWSWQWVFPATRHYVDGQRQEAKASPARVSSSEGLQGGRSPRSNGKTRQPAHLETLVRHTSAGVRAGHPHDPGTPGTSGREHHHDLHPRS